MRSATAEAKAAARARARARAIIRVVAWLAVAGPAAADERILDDFEDLAAWKVSATDDVRAALRSADGAHGKALCIDYDFGRVAGYVTARRALPMVYPARYEFGLEVRGAGSPNALQVKLVDAGGENVWWVNRPEFRFPRDWQPLKLRQHQIEFAWGPSTDRTLRATATIELVIASGSGAGRGSACFDRLTFRRLPDEGPQAPAPVLSSDGLSVDYGLPREFGALGVHWHAGAAASRYAIELSDDGAVWRRVRRVERARGEVQTHWLPESEARFVRVVPDASPPRAALVKPTSRASHAASASGTALAASIPGSALAASAPGAALDAIEPLDAATANAFFLQLARQAPRGRYPRAYANEQSYWTVLGVDGARTASLLNEDGVLEPRPGVGGLEPMLVADGRVLTWADARIAHTLHRGDLPMPAVHWRLDRDALALDLESFADGPPDAPFVVARYTVRNLGRRPRDLTLALAWRPFQANPPTQFLAHPGGASELGEMDWDGRVLRIDAAVRLQPTTPPSEVRIEPFAAGSVVEGLGAEAPIDRPSRVDDPARFPSAALRYDLHLAPHEARSVVVLLPVADAAEAPSPRTSFEAARRRVAAAWRERLDRVTIRGPGEVADIARTLRTALGHILVNRSGPALQPGARAYARSWIRDGALTSSALLRLGHAQEVRTFLNWYGPMQFGNGKVPCCATARGADPVPENDSDGEFAFAVADYWRHTHDAATVRALWPRVRAAVQHMETLRQSERTERNRTPERAAYFGLMPPSISHEGYSDKPAYSYWDDFWAATGYRSALELAQALALPDDAARIAAQRTEFEADLERSIAASTARYRLDVLPGAADRGDVDPTSSTIALSPGGFEGRLPDALLRNTFDRYWRDFEARRRDEAAGVRHGDGAYTPYEWRNVGALVRLGERERALDAMRYFDRDRRPAGWNQWAEVVARDQREPRFVGDMPHGWVASDQIRAVLDLFAYEHEGAQRLVLAAGVPMAWFDGPGLSIDGLRTPYGRLGWNAHATRRAGRRTIEFGWQGLASRPPGGIVLRGPWPAASRVWIDGYEVAGSADAIALPDTPARVRIELPQSR